MTGVTGTTGRLGNAVIERLLNRLPATEVGATVRDLDALEMALWARGHTGHPITAGLIHHSDAGSQYTSSTVTDHLLAAGIDASTGSVGDAYDNALAESTIGLYKTELINRQGPWHTRDQVEYATLEYIDWYNNRLLHSSIGHLSPDEAETVYYRQHQPTPAGAVN